MQSLKEIIAQIEMPFISKNELEQRLGRKLIPLTELIIRGKLQANGITLTE